LILTQAGQRLCFPNRNLKRLNGLCGTVLILSTCRPRSASTEKEPTGYEANACQGSLHQQEDQQKQTGQPRKLCQSDWEMEATRPASPAKPRLPTKLIYPSPWAVSGGSVDRSKAIQTFKRTWNASPQAPCEKVPLVAVITGLPASGLKFQRLLDVLIAPANGESGASSLRDP
jgi:hypothetical protein